MLEPKSAVPLIYNNGDSYTYGINVGKYPYHCYIGDMPREVMANVPLKVDFCRQDEWISGCYRKRICYELYTLEMVNHGSLLLVQNGRICRVNAGEMYLLHRGYDNEMLVDQPCLRKTTIAFSGNMLNSILLLAGLKNTDKIVPDKPERFRGFFDDMLREVRRREEGFQLRSSAIAYNLLLELGRSLMYEGMPEMIRDAMLLMDRMIDKQVSIEDFCSSLNTSPATLNRTFRKYLHMPPMEFFIRLKMESASKMLRNTNYSIKQVAEMTGYSNQLYFSSEFRKRIGVSPKAYRRGSDE